MDEDKMTSEQTADEAAPAAEVPAADSAAAVPETEQPETAAANENTPEEQKPAGDSVVPAPAEPAAEEKEAPAPETDPAPETADSGETVPAEETSDRAEPPAEETPDEAPDAPEPPKGDTPDGETPPEPAEEEPKMSEEERRRVVEMTRTVQVSLEQILARMADDTEPAPEGDEALPQEEPEMEPEGPSLGRRIGYAAGRGVLDLLKWVLLVIFFVALIAGGGIAYLYRGASADMLPHITVTVGGETLDPASYDWKVPVVNDLLSRRYHGIFNEEPQYLATTMGSGSVGVTVAPDMYDSHLTVRDSAGKELFSGTLQEFESYYFEENGSYTAELTLRNDRSDFGGTAEVTGEQTYRFAFEIGVPTTAHLSARTARQGDVAAVVVSGVSANTAPELETNLPVGGMIRSGSGWVVYLPIAVDQEPGEYAVGVHAGALDCDLTLTVEGRTWPEKKLRKESELHWAYLGANDTPAAVRAVLGESDEEAHWERTGFVLPYVQEVEPELEYGLTETVDSTGASRVNINEVSGGRYGETLMSPADGRVLLAEDLGGGESLPNKVVVIEHGGGLKTVFYNLRSIDVKVGDTVLQRQKIGESQLTVVAAAYVGDIPVEPLTIWRGQCGAFKYF